MKKTVRRLFAVMLAVLMCVSLSVVAFAAEPDPAGYDITVETTVPNAGTLNAYQIFKGDLADDEKKPGKFILSNIEWGDNIDKNAAVTAMKPLITDGTVIDYNAPDKGAAAVAKWLQDHDTQAAAFAKAIRSCVVGDAADTVKDDGTHTTPTDGHYNTLKLHVARPGYYLIDSDDTNGVENAAATSYILAVVGNVTVTEKASFPSVEKKVQDVNDSAAESEGTNPTGWQDSADYDIGDEVPFQLTGALPSTYDSYASYNYIFHDTLSAGLTYVDGSAKVYVVNGEDEPVDVTEYFTITGSLTVSIDDLKTIPTNTVSITKDSKIVVEYSATLNENAVIGSVGNPNEVYLEYSNNPNAGGDGKTGTTPHDTVIVFTFELKVDKIDPDKQPLEGAGFTLSKWNPTAGEDGLGAFEAVHFKQVTKEVDGASKTYYVVDPEGDVTEIAGEDITNFEFCGIDDGQYKLEETTTPPGYNTCAPIEFTVEATHEGETLTELKAVGLGENGSDVNGDVDTGLIVTNVVNTEGSRLPSTGGIGTTIFYIVGATLVIGAGILLVTKRRMSNRG